MPQVGRESTTLIAARHATAAAGAGCGGASALGAADGLGLAAAPTFTIMALLTSALGGGPSDMLCSGNLGASPLDGMVVMYMLMSVFHAAPWLKLASRRRGDAGPDPTGTDGSCP